MKVKSTHKNDRFNFPETTIPDIKFFTKRMKIIENIRKLHSNAPINQKSNILSVVSYNSLKKLLRDSKFKFSDSQFSIARNKRKEDRITLDNYQRHVPYTKRKIAANVVEKIKEYLNKFSRESPHEDGVKYLERSKKEIYRAYINEERDNITYGTFIKYFPKNYKKGVKRTDVCGICELSKTILKKTYSSLSKEDKKEYEMTKDIYDMHKLVVDNQKTQFNLLKENLSDESCILILDYKENFKLSFGGHQVSQDYYEKRQISCLGACLIFKSNGDVTRHYLNILSEILSHDSLFSSDGLSLIIKELKRIGYRSINVFTDCGPHFRSNEFIYSAKTLSSKYNINISVNFFGEHHGKSEVDGMFGKLSVVFKSIDYNSEIHNVYELKNAFEDEYKLRKWNNVFFTVYERDSRPKFIKKMKFKDLKKVMSFLFMASSCYYSNLTKIDKDYKEFEPKTESKEDTRETSYTPKTCFASRIKRFFNQNIHKILKARVRQL